MPTPPEEPSFACRVHTLAREINAAAARLLQPFDVTPAQALLLYELVHGQTSPSAIAERMAIDPSNLSRMIRALGDRGLIDREVDDANRTRVTLSLTPAGRRLARRIDPHAAAIQRAFTQTLNAKQQAAFAQCLARMTEALASVGVMHSTR